MRYYAEHVEHALQRGLVDHTLADGREIKDAWPWVWAVLKRLKVFWVDLGDPPAVDLLGQEWVGIETSAGYFRIRATSTTKTDKGVDYEFEFQQVNTKAPDGPTPHGD